MKTPDMSDKGGYKEPVCRGSWAFGNNCRKCAKCLDTKPASESSRSNDTRADEIVAMLEREYTHAVYSRDKSASQGDDARARHHFWLGVAIDELLNKAKAIRDKQ